MPDDQPKPENHIEGAEPRVVLGIDRGYPPVTASDMATGERQMVDAIIGAGLDMRCAEGFRRPCIIPPAVALAIARAMMAERVKAYLHGTVKATPEIEAHNILKAGDYTCVVSALPTGATVVRLEGGATGWLTRDGKVWQRNHPSGFVQVDTKIAPETWGDKPGGQGG